MTKSKRATQLQVIKALADQPAIGIIAGLLKDSFEYLSDSLDDDNLEVILYQSVNPANDYEAEFEQYGWQIRDSNFPRITEDIKPVLRAILDAVAIDLLVARNKARRH